MVVPLLLLGSVTKLAFAVAATHRTRAWWLPGAVAIALGALGALHPGATRTVGTISVLAGTAAIIAAGTLRQRALALVRGR
jgi:hypothetical protein